MEENLVFGEKCDLLHFSDGDIYDRVDHYWDESWTFFIQKP